MIRLKSILHAIRSFTPLFLSHHPECDNFFSHTIRIGKVRFCIGCFIGYPSAFIGIIVIDLLQLKNYVIIENYFVIGVSLLLTFILSFTPLTKIKIIKIVQKILIGLGSSFLFWGIWYQPISFLEKYIIFSISFGLIITFLNLYHVYGFWSTCYKCDTPFGWHTCSGFKTIRDNFKNHNLNDFFSYFKDYSESIKNKKELRKKDKLT